MTGDYHAGLVALSVLIAIVASYTALDLAGRTRAARGVRRWIWLSWGATAMGIGIWAMHYLSKPFKVVQLREDELTRVRAALLAEQRIVP